MQRLKTITLVLISLTLITQAFLYQYDSYISLAETVSSGLAEAGEIGLFAYTSIDFVLMGIVIILPLLCFCFRNPAKKEMAYTVTRYIVIIQFIIRLPMSTLIHLVQGKDMHIYAQFVFISVQLLFLIYCIILLKIKPQVQRPRISTTVDYLSVSLATRANRLSHLVIDTSLFLLSFPLWSLNIVFNDYEDYSIPIATMIVTVFFYMLYYWLSEAMFRATLGKILTGTMVVGTKKRMGAGRAFNRSICRLIPLEAISFLSGHNWHDKLTSTAVVYINSLEEDFFPDEQPANKPIH
ncbi:RDD family protein [Pseudoflavitalea sp. G-6-1-2]|uniref:RDD family protein n=1 Tax=Pseudoflavitalea sp. G-6-1-2 TaxID=2728841 RepID=UPI00146BADAA|nr:RDD family protein [Pseudoflavitalea sp. G-6-1-2]NML19814.1 RDD family protein [Pseudoflavitalea sp. G-6-1-2]